MNKRSCDSNKVALTLVSSVGTNFDLMLVFFYNNTPASIVEGNQSSIIFVILFLVFAMKLL